MSNEELKNKAQLELHFESEPCNVYLTKSLIVYTLFGGEITPAERVSTPL
jgi:hypothetical protein